MKQVNKYLYGWRISVNYGQGYEYECFELSYKAMRQQVRCYLKDCPYPVKITRGREPNPDYTITNSQKDQTME